MLDSMERLIREEGLFPPGCRVLCAVSGGADSVCLLHSLWGMRGRLGISVAAAHYNHQLRGGESHRDEEFVRALCAQLGDIPLVVERGDVAGAAQQSGRGIEETARELRYAFLRRAAAQMGASVIATAHNADDNAETVLLHLIRGSGLRGLTGIPVVRGDIVRPLLTTPRDKIKQYNRAYGLSWVTDSSNRDERFTRNRVRRQVLPLLDEICPGVRERLNRTAELLREDEDCLMEQASLLAQKAEGDHLEQRIPAELLREHHRAVSVRVIRILLGRLRRGNEDCAAVHLDGVLDLCGKTSPSAWLPLPGGLTAGREYDMLVLSARQTAQPLTRTALAMPGVTRTGDWALECRRVEYRGEGQQPFRFYLSCEAGEITLRGRQTGDRLERPGRPGKTVKKWFIEEKIPLRVRDTLPVLEIGGRLAAVAGLGVDGAYVPQPGTRCWEITVEPIR